jgi:glycosyltransferase involved in cell wall biosynthesis
VPRVLFVTGTPPSVREGSGTFVGVSVLASALRDAGVEVHVLAPEPDGRPVSFGRRLLFDLRARRLAAALGPVDATVAVDLDGAFLRRPRGRSRSVAAVKGGRADEARFERGAARLRLRLESVVERWSVRRADIVVVPSGYSKARVEEDCGVPASRIRVVPEPIDLARWDAALSAAPRRPVPGPFTIVSVAHLYPRKDIATLLEAVARFPDGSQGREVRLRVVGDGPERDRLAGRIRDLGLSGRVELLGHLAFDRLAAELAGADVFCLPSLQEAFGIVFLEAMAAALPIVAARAGAVPDTVPDGECGILVPPADASSLAGALGRLLADDGLRRAMGEAGRRRVRDYDAPRVAATFLEAIAIAVE